MTQDFTIAGMVKGLEAAGYTPEQIGREVDYVEYTQRQDAKANASREWNYGFHHAKD